MSCCVQLFVGGQSAVLVSQFCSVVAIKYDLSSKSVL